MLIAGGSARVASPCVPKMIMIMMRQRSIECGR